MNEKVRTIKESDSISEMRRLHREGYLLICSKCHSEILFNDSEIQCSGDNDHFYITINKTRYLRQKWDLRDMKEGIEIMKGNGYSKEEIINYVEKHHSQYLEFFDYKTLKVNFDFDNFNIKTGKFDKNDTKSNYVSS